MATMLHLELTHEATPLDRLVETVRATATRLTVLARVVEAADPANTLVVLTSGLLVDVDPPFASGEDPFVADFGMTRAATVDFTYDSRHEGADRQQDELLRMVFGLLETVPGDAVLHYEYYVVYLARLGGRLVLSDADDLWSPEDLVHVPEPYQRSPLAFRTM
jgi:hypothetical protein